MEQGAGLNDQLNQISKYYPVGSNDYITIKAFYNEYYDKVRQFASQYIYIMGIGSIFALYSQFISLLVIAEGRQTIVVIASTVCNGINILLD
jgi:Na+-driven multidrug efflux pump